MSGIRRKPVCIRVSGILPEVSLAEGGVFKGRHFDRSVILLYIRWYLAYNLSLRNLEEMMAERGISVDHATVHRWVITRSTRVGIMPDRQRPACCTPSTAGGASWSLPLISPQDAVLSLGLAERSSLKEIPARPSRPSAWHRDSPGRCRSPSPAAAAPDLPFPPPRP